MVHRLSVRTSTLTGARPITTRRLLPVNPANTPINASIQPSRQRPRLKAIAQSMIRRGAVHPRAQSDNRTEFATSSRSGGVGSDAVWERRIAAKRRPQGFPRRVVERFSGRFVPLAADQIAVGFIRAGRTRTLNSRAAAIRRRSDDLGVGGKSAPVGSALSYVIVRRGCNRATSDAVRRAGPRPSQSLRARRRRPSKTLCHAQPKNLVRGTSIVRSHPASDHRRSGGLSSAISVAEGDQRESANAEWRQGPLPFAWQGRVNGAAINRPHPWSGMPQPTNLMGFRSRVLDRSQRLNSRAPAASRPVRSRDRATRPMIVDFAGRHYQVP
jgi:hypothetical protein